jgi:hypothetical protein
LKCFTVVTNGVLGEAEPDGGVAVPLEHVTVTGTEATGPLGEYTLFTVNVVLVSVFVIVQLAGTAFAIATEPQFEVAM